MRILALLSLAVVLLPARGSADERPLQVKKVEENCPGIYGLAFPDPAQYPVPAALEQKPPVPREAPRLEVPAAQPASKLEKRMLEDLYFGVNLLFPEPRVAEGGFLAAAMTTRGEAHVHQLIFGIEQNVGPLSLDPAYVKKFAKYFGVLWRPKARRAIQTLIDAKQNPVEASQAMDRLRARVMPFYQQQWQAMLDRKANPKLMERMMKAAPFAAAMSPMWALIGSFVLAGNGHAGLPGLIPGAAYFVFFASSLTLPTRYDFAYGRFGRMVRNELRKGVRDRELDVDLEKAWEKWKSSIAENYRKSQDPQETDLRLNADRLLSTVELLTYFHRLELPNGAPYSEVFGKSAEITPQTLQEMREGARRKRAQLDLMAQELARIGDQAETLLHGSVESSDAFRKLTEAGVTPANAPFLESVAKRLPADRQTSFVQAAVARLNANGIEKARDQLDRVDRLLEEYGNPATTPARKQTLREEIRSALSAFRQMLEGKPEE